MRTPQNVSALDPRSRLLGLVIMMMVVKNTNDDGGVEDDDHDQDLGTC